MPPCLPELLPLLPKAPIHVNIVAITATLSPVELLTLVDLMIGKID